MLTRTAIYEGAFEPGTDEDGFFPAVHETLEPIWRTSPEVLDVRVHRERNADPGAISVVMTLGMDFADRASLNRSLASALKEQSHARTLDVLKPFKGRLLPPRRGHAPRASLSGRERAVRSGEADGGTRASACQRRNRLASTPSNPTAVSAARMR